MHKREKSKATRPCDVCGCEVARVYRVIVEAGGDWVFVCDDCWARVREGNPAYRYGGTWTSRRRR